MQHYILIVISMALSCSYALSMPQQKAVQERAHQNAAQGGSRPAAAAAAHIARPAAAPAQAGGASAMPAEQAHDDRITRDQAKQYHRDLKETLAQEPENYAALDILFGAVKESFKQGHFLNCQESVQRKFSTYTKRRSEALHTESAKGTHAVHKLYSEYAQHTLSPEKKQRFLRDGQDALLKIKSWDDSIEPSFEANLKAAAKLVPNV